MTLRRPAVTSNTRTRQGNIKAYTADWSNIIWSGFVLPRELMFLSARRRYSF